MNGVKTDSSEYVYDAWLASACIPPDKTRQLLDLYGKPECCFNAFQRRDEEVKQIVSQRFLNILERNGTDKNLMKMQKLMKDFSIGVIRYNDPEYPEMLNDIDEPPAILFFQGEILSLKNRMLSMVGSRAASYSGQRAARKIAGDLSRYGISIISGLACGIDAASHTGCIEGGSPTIAVTACGLDIVYPKDHIRMRDDILNHHGLILSEYAPGEKPVGWHFPFRNRIIAGLGSALILIEARIRSGSMTSVKHALDQGKDIFVYPGDPDSEQFEGNHQLLREGGIYFTASEDILHDLHWLDNQSGVRQNSDCYTETKVSAPGQEAVIRALKPGNLGFEQLLEKTGLDPSVLMGTLTILQISGMIESLPGKKYQLKH